MANFSLFYKLLQFLLFILLLKYYQCQTFSQKRNNINTHTHIYKFLKGIMSSKVIFFGISVFSVSCNKFNF